KIFVTCSLQEGAGRIDRPLAVLPSINDPPDSPALAVATGVRQWHLVVADDPVVEIGHIDGPVWSELEGDRAEPGVVAHEEIGLLDGARSRPAPLESVLIDPIRDRITDENAVVICLREVVGRVIDNAGDGRRPVVVAAHLRAEAEAVVGLAEARVIGPAKEL